FARPPEAAEPRPAAGQGRAGPTPAGARQPSGLGRLQWRREGGWLRERASGSAGADGALVEASKASIACGSRDGARFVVASLGAESEAYMPDCGEEVRGVFVKVPGQTLRPLALEGSDVSPVSIWASSVEPGTLVLLAIVGLEENLLSEVLAALQPLGVPSGPAPLGCRALAASGVVAALGQPGPCWESAHASTDVAYASALIPG
ncbi:unnamed protein product, partial [Prorocentrum cordatum]